MFVRDVFLDISDENLRGIKIICLDVFEFYLRWNYNLISKKFFLHSYVENLLFTQNLNIIETFFLKHSNISRELRLFPFFQIFEENYPAIFFLFVFQIFEEHQGFSYPNTFDRLDNDVFIRNSDLVQVENFAKDEKD